MYDKVKLIKASNGQSVRKLADQFQCGKSTVSDILKKQNAYLEQFEEIEKPNAKRLNKASFSEELNKAVYAWFTRVRTQNIPVSGPLLQAQAVIFAKQLGFDEFKGSNGWLENFRKRFNIRFQSVSGEGASVDIDVVDNWKEKVHTLIEGYDPENVFNMDETGLFFRALPKKT